MKQYIFIFLITIYGCANRKTQNARKEINKVTEPTSNTFDVALSNINLNFLYCNIRNNMELNMRNYDSTKWKVTTDNGDISINRYGKIWATPTKLGVVRITLNKIESDGELKPKSMFTLRVKELPTPMLRLNTNSLEMFNKDSLLSLNKLDCVIPSFDYNIKFHIKSFNLELFSKNQMLSIVCYDNIFSDDAKKKIKELNAGDKVAFTHIIAKREGNDKSIFIPSRIITIE